MPFTDAYEQQLLDGVLGDPDFTQEDLWVGLSSTTPTDSGTNVTEPSGGAYARIAISTTAGGAPNFGAASGTAPAEKSNSAIIAFVQASADWWNVSGGPATHLVIYNAATVGTCRGWGALGTARAVLNTDTASFPIGALDLRLGKGTPG